MTPLSHADGTSFTDSSPLGNDSEQREALAAQLLATAREIDGYRKARGRDISDRAWCKEWPGLGSPKTWAKILKGDLTDISVESKLPEYRGALAAVSAQRKSYAAEELYDDLAGAQAVKLAALRMMHHHGKDRLLLIQGGSGSGKTSALDLLARGEATGSMIQIEANDTWKSERVAMHDLLRGLGQSEEVIQQLATTGDRLEAILAILSRRGRVLLAIDEAHHCTGRVLNLCKTLLNRTECLLIMAGMATLLQKLRASASEESKQLIHNRLFCSVRLHAPDVEGARQFLRRRLRIEEAWKPSTLTRITEDARHLGDWSYLRRVVDHLITSGIQQPDDADLMAAAAAAAREIA
jgi:type II secretory pathway predicted ATPase ExeA